MNMQTDVMNCLIEAKRADQFPHRGELAVSVNKGKFQVQRVQYGANGIAKISPCTKFLPLALAMIAVFQEARYGIGEV